MPRTPEPLVIPFFATGLYTHRSQLFSPYRAIGVNVVTYHDAAIDGQDMELTTLLEWQRRPGFSRYCSQAFAAGEIPNQFYSIRQPNGTVVDFVDTNQNFSTFTTTAITSLFAKSTTAQGFVKQVGQMSYVSNGMDFKKWDGTNVSGWGIAAPVLAPTVSQAVHKVAFWEPLYNYPNYGTYPPIIVDPNGNFQLASSAGGGVAVTGASQPVWNTVLGGATIDGTQVWTNEGPYSAWQPSTAYGVSQIVTDTAGNLELMSHAAGTSGTTVPSWGSTINASTTDSGISWLLRGSGANGDSVTGNGLVTIQAGYMWCYAYRSVWGHLSTASPVTPSTGIGIGPFSVGIGGVGTGDTQCNQTLTITSVAVSGNVLTIIFSNTPKNLVPGQNYTFSGVGTATFLNAQSVAVSTVVGNTFTAPFTHANYGPTADTGSANFNGVEIYRNADGGGLLYYDSSLPNPGANTPWTFTDTNPDANLITSFIAPLNHANDPPPGQVGSITFASRTGAFYRFTSLSRASNIVTGIFLNPFPLPIGATLSIGGTGSSFDGGPFTLLSVVPIFSHGRLNGYTVTWAQTAAPASFGAGMAFTGTPPPAGTIIEFWQGRLWMAAGNQVFFDAGPDCTNGVPEESWPPANVFSFSGPVYGLRKTSEGLLVWGHDYVSMVLGGPQTLSFYPYDLLENFGISNPNCIAQDGDTMWVLTTQQQCWELSLQGKSDEGNYVVDLIQQDFASSASYVTMHRNGTDSGLWLGDGAVNLLRYSLTVGSWSTLYAPVGGMGAINSIETSPGTMTLIAGRASAAGYILARNLNNWQDDGQNYTNCFVTIGNITLSQPLAPLFPVYFISAYLDAVGGLTAGGPSQPAMAILPNEVSGTPGVGFITLGQPVQEPPIGQNEPSSSLQALRWQVDSMVTGTVSQLMHHLQVRITFAPENAPNTIKALAIGFDKDA